MATPALPLPSIFKWNNVNNEYFVWGPLVDGLLILQNPPVYQYITDLTITITLYANRDITNPSATPGTVVTSFGTGGSIQVPYTGSLGVYIALVPAASVAPGTYVLVIDAPISSSGYQGHWEKSVLVQTRQN